MSEAKVKVFTKSSAGKIKKLNGGNLAPPITGEKAGRNIRSSFAELNMPLTRLHDAPLENAGARLVDVPLIFANFHADETDPRNYYFRQTDDYIRNCIELGCGILYRLGTSIEHGFNKYFTAPPPDTDKWINICDRIIRHYTEGWANGFNFRIRYWEIWNEPECCDADGLHLMWGGTLQEYNEFYVKTATELKKRFPHLMFGGPAHCGYSSLSTDFINFCAKNKAPLDFYSYHCYAKDPYGWIQETPGLVRKDLDAAGYKNTEIHLNEWHYFPGDWRRLRSDPDYKDKVYEEMKGLDSAAFLCTVMALWQDTPLDMGCYYTATTTAWGCYRTGSAVPTKSYYGLKAFGEIVRYPERIKTTSSKKEFTALAARDENGGTALLVSAFLAGKSTLTIECDAKINPDTCKVYLLDDENNLQETLPEFRKNAIRLNLNASSAVVLVKFS